MPAGLLNWLAGRAIRQVTARTRGALPFLPDGTILASVSDFNILLWRIPDLILLRILTGLTEYITSLTFSPDGHTLASGSMDGKASLWPISEQGYSGFFGHTAQCYVSVYNPPPPTMVDLPIYSLAFSPESDMLLTGGFIQLEMMGMNVNYTCVQEAFHLWQIKGDQQIIVHPVDQGWQVAFSPDGETFAVGGRNNIEIRRLSDQAIQSTLSEVYVDAIAYSPNGSVLASGGSTIRLLETLERFRWHITAYNRVGEPIWNRKYLFLT